MLEIQKCVGVKLGYQKQSVAFDFTDISNLTKILELTRETNYKSI